RQGAHPRVKQLGGLGGPQQRRGEDHLRRRVGKPGPELRQLGAALLTQRQVGAAADVPPVQVALGQTVADQVELEVQQMERLLGKAGPPAAGPAGKYWLQFSYNFRLLDPPAVFRAQYLHPESRAGANI